MKNISKKILLLFIIINFILCQCFNVKAEGGMLEGTREQYNAYRETLKSIYLSNVTTLHEAYYDIDNNGIEELIAFTGESEAEKQIYFFTYENGNVIELGKISGGHTTLYPVENKNYILSVWGHMGHEIITHISIENNKLVEDKVSDYELDKSTDERQETITIEGLEETITTAKYVSSLGYSMRWHTDRFGVSKDEEMDVYTSDSWADTEVYFTVDRSYGSLDGAISGSIAGGVNIENIIINGNTAVTYRKEVADILQTYYFIEAGNALFIITVYYPNTSEYIGGWGSRIAQMINTFEVRELGVEEVISHDFPNTDMPSSDIIIGEWIYNAIQKDGKDVKFEDVFGDRVSANTGSMIFNTDGTFIYSLPGTSSEDKISGIYLYSDTDEAIYLTYNNKRKEIKFYEKEGKIEQKYGEYVLTLTKKQNSGAQNNNKQETPKDNTNSGKDTTQATTKIPQTGITNYILIGMAVVIVATIVFFIKYRRYK